MIGVGQSVDQYSAVMDGGSGVTMIGRNCKRKRTNETWGNTGWIHGYLRQGIAKTSLFLVFTEYLGLYLL